MNNTGKKTDKINDFLNNNRIITVLIYIMAAGLLALNFIRIFDNTFWGDEAYSINLTRMGFSSMIGQIAYDVQAPFFYLVLRVCGAVFGGVGAAYHMASFLAYMLMMAFIVFPVRKEYGNIVTAVMVVFTSLSMNSLIYMTELRPYEWGCALVFISYFYGLRIINKEAKTSDWVLFSVVSLMAAYTHTYCLIAVAFMYVGIILLALFGKRDEMRKIRIRTAVICIVAVIVYLPWLMVLFSQFGAAKGDWWQRDIPSVRDLFVYHFDFTWMAIIVLFAIVAFLISSVGGEAIRTLLLGLAPIIGTAAVGLGICYFVRPMFLDKYFFPLAGISWFLLGYMFSKIRLGGAPAVLVVAFFVLAGAKNYRTEFSNARYIDAGNTAFLENVKLDENCVVYANSDHYHWAILPCYYPAADVRNAEGAKFDFEGVDGKDIYLVWSTEIGPAEETAFAELGKSLTQVYTGNIGNHLTVYVYKAGAKCKL